jgi:hypothetical protein
MPSFIEVHEVQSGGSVQRKLVPYNSNSQTGIGLPSNQYCTVEELGDGVTHKTILTMVNMPVTVGNTTGVSFGGRQIYAFPLGRLYVIMSTLGPVTFGLADAGNVTPIDGTMGGDVAIGTTVVGDGTATGADVDLVPSTSIDPISAGSATATLAAAAFFDGTGTAKNAFFNILIDDADVANAASDILLVNGVWRCIWQNGSV